MMTTGAAFHTLPQELLDLILESCSEDPFPTRIKTLDALCRVSKRLRYAAEPFLYRSLLIDDHPGGGILLHRFQQFRNSLHVPRTKYQMTLVKEMRILREVRWNSALEPFPWCFSNFTNLKTLVVVDPNAHHVLCRLPATLDPFPALESCTLSLHNCGRVREHETIGGWTQMNIRLLWPFLGLQKLKRFEISGCMLFPGPQTARNPVNLPALDCLSLVDCVIVAPFVDELVSVRMIKTCLAIRNVFTRSPAGDMRAPSMYAFGTSLKEIQFHQAQAVMPDLRSFHQLITVSLDSENLMEPHLSWPSPFPATIERLFVTFKVLDGMWSWCAEVYLTLAEMVSAKEHWFPHLHYLGLEFAVSCFHGGPLFGVSPQQQRYCEELFEFRRDGKLIVDPWSVANLGTLYQACQQAGVHIGRSRRHIWRKGVRPFARKGEQETAWIGNLATHYT